MTEGKKKKSVTLTEFMLHKASMAKIPFSGTFELSPICNFSCQMCYVRKTAKEVKEHPRDMMTLKQWLKIAEEAYDAGMLHLLLTGGEPFLWPDFWILYERLVQMGFLVAINTNGSLIDATALDRLKKLPPRRVNITLYGTSDVTYEKLCNVKGVFSKVDHAIMELREAGIPIKLNCSLTPTNAGDLEEMIRYAKERELILDVAPYMFPPIRRNPDMVGENERFTPEESAKYRLQTYRFQNGEERYKEYLEQLLEGSVPPPGLDESCVDPLDGRIRCRAGNASFWITWDGQMFPCGMVPNPKMDLYEMDFAEAWRQMSEICDGLKLSGVCSECANKDICHACAAMAIAETGNVSGIPVYLCETVKAMKKIAEHELKQ
ncbi:MAG: radical SAM/SPASM domain-containing protein [Lachnospiraceae bacterium]